MKKTNTKLSSLITDEPTDGINKDFDLNDDVKIPLNTFCKLLLITIITITKTNLVSIPIESNIPIQGFSVIVNTIIDEINTIITDENEKNPNSELFFSANVFPRNLFMPIGISRLETATKIIANELIEPTIPTTLEFVKFDAINQNP